MSRRLALLDGDVLLYQNGFASDAAAKALYRQKNNGSDEGFDIQEHHEPLEYCLHGAKETIDSIMRAAEADDKMVWLSHPVNYREQFYPEYKMNRDVTHKPFWYDELKEYLLDRHNALFSEQGDEADDALGMAQMRAIAKGEETIICTIDKDLDMIPGLHYNFSKNNREKGVYVMQDPDALSRFYTQIVTGDSADNIPGLYAWSGKKTKARKELTYPIEFAKTEKEMLNHVLRIFNNDVEHVALMGKLLWIKRDEKFWEIPT